VNLPVGVQYQRNPVKGARLRKGANSAERFLFCLECSWAKLACLLLSLLTSAAAKAKPRKLMMRQSVKDVDLRLCSQRGQSGLVRRRFH
jgi:hypothetical protein